MQRWIFALLLLCLPTVLNAQWREATSRHFTLYSQGSEEELRKTAAALERFDRLLRPLMEVGEERSPRLKIFLMPDREAVVRTTDGSDPHLAGYYTHNADEPILVASRAATGNGKYDIAAQDVLFHEYAHHIMLQHSNGPHPVWYLEGLAEYYSTARLLEGNAVEIGAAPASRVAVLREAENWIPVGELLATTSYRQFSDRLHLLYAQAWLLTHYVTQDPQRRAQLQAYFRLVSAGMERRNAVDTAFGKDAGEFDRQLRSYARRNDFARQRVHGTVPAGQGAAVRALRRAEADLIGFEVALRRGVESARSADFLRELGTAGQRHFDDPYTQHLLALAGQRMGGEAVVAATLAASAGTAGPAGGR